MLVVNLVGNLGKDAESKVLDNGKTVISFSVCVNEKVKTGSEYVEQSTWLKVSFFTNSNTVLTHLKKGVKVFVCGKLSIEIYQSKNTGKEMFTINVIASNLQILEFKNESQNTVNDDEDYKQKTYL
jgi:single-strand DNA-binding protein